MISWEKSKNHSKEKADNGLEIDEYCLELSYQISEERTTYNGSETTII